MYFPLLTGVMLLCLSAPCLAQVQKFPPGVFQTDCLSRSFFIWVNRTFFRSSPWQLEAINATGSPDVMQANRAAQCGYTVTTDVYGNVVVRISFLGCWVNNLNDNQFNVTVQFRVSKVRVYPVSMSCIIEDQWDVREMVCEENYMEVTVKTIPAMLKVFTSGPVNILSSSWQVWFNNSNVPIPAKNGISKGYGINATVSRVVFRAPHNTSEAQIVQVGNYHLDVIASNTLFSQTLLRFIVDTTLACPIDPPVYTATTLSWLTPAILSPLVTGSFTERNFTMGVNGQLLDLIQINENQYIFNDDSSTVEVTIPFGAPGGYVESDVVNNTYMTTYKINLLLQRHWLGVNEDDSTTHTAYKPVVAPIIVQVFIFLNHTIKEDSYFNVSLGNFYSDVSLKSFILHGVPIALTDVNGRHMTVATTINPNNTQAFYLTVPFSDPVVEQTYLGGFMRRYRLYVTYVLTLVTKNKDFMFQGVVECEIEDVVPPTINGTCEDDRLGLNVTRGNMDRYWLPYIRDLPLTDAFIASQNITVKNSAAFLYIGVPYTSVGLNYEVVTLAGSLVSVNFTFRNNQTQTTKFSYSLSCPFPTRTLLCLSNGTMIALINSTVTKPAFDAQNAHLRDPTCTPQEATAEAAIFNFTAYSCGTTSRFDSNYLVYENEVTFDREVLFPEQPIISRDSSFRMTLRCRYPIRDTLWVGAMYKTSNAIPAGLASSGTRVLRRRARTHVAELKLAKDENFTAFYQNGDFPVSAQATDLYFQANVQSPGPITVLKDCWATTFPGQDGITRWDLIVDGCGAVAETFSTEVQTSPSWLPRFKVTLHDAPTSQLFIHCKLLICDATTQPESCPKTCNQSAPLMDKRFASLPTEMVSAGPIQIMAPQTGVVFQYIAGEETSWATWTWVLSLGLAVISAFTVGAIFLTVRLYRQ